MSQLRAPLADMQFVMTELADLDEIAALPGYADATPDIVAAIELNGSDALKKAYLPKMVADRRAHS